MTEAADRQPEGSDPKSITSFLIRGGGVTLIARLIAVATGFGTQVALARLLDPGQLGAFFLTQSVVIATADVGQLGLPRVIVRELAKATGSDRWGYATSFLIRSLAIGFVCIAVVSVFYSEFLGPILSDVVFESDHMSGTVRIVAIWIAGLAVQNIVSESLRGIHAVGWASVFGGALASFLTCSVLGMALLFGYSAQLSEVLIVAAGGTIVSAGFAGLVLKGRMRSAASEMPPAVAPILKSAVAMLVLGMSSTVLAQSDLWILGIVLSEEDVALYGAAKRLIVLISLPLMIVTLVVPPLISDLYAKGEIARLERVLRGTASVAGLPSLVVLGLFAVFGGSILAITFGEFFRPAGRVLMILSFERMLFVYAGACGMLLMMTGHERLMLRVTLLAGAIQIGTIYAGSRMNGIEGAAVGLLIGSSVRTVALLGVAKISTGIRTDISFGLAREGLGLFSDAILRGVRGRG